MTVGIHAVHAHRRFCRIEIGRSAERSCLEPRGGGPARQRKSLSSAKRPADDVGLIAFRLLLVALDDARVSNAGGVGVEASLAQRATLAQEVPALVERDLELLHPLPVGFRLHHLPSGMRFRLGRMRCLAYGGARPVRSSGGDRGWFRAAALERAAVERLAGSGEIDVLFCHDPRTLEQGPQARGAFAALVATLRPALVIYAHQHRPHVSAVGDPALVGLGSFKDGPSSAVVFDSAETGRLVRALRQRQTAARPEAAGHIR